MAKTNATLSGQVQLEIDEQGLTCHLAYRRTNDGEEWDADRIIGLLREKGVKEGVSKEEIARNLKIIAEKGQKEARFPVAKGTVPEDPIPEQASWANLALPKELQDRVTDIAKSFGGPEIVVEKVEKVKNKKTVPKKSVLPFGGKKEEVVEVVEKRVSKERVYVDPTVEQYGYAERGAKIGTIEMSGPGTPGRNIFGEPVASKALADPYFYVGTGVVRQKSELVAESTGIVRIGKNWVDLVPFPISEWDVEMSEDMATCFLLLSPGDDRAPAPTSGDVLERAKTVGCPQDQLLSEREVGSAIQHGLDRGDPHQRIPLTHSDDSYFTVDIDHDKMKATLTARKGRGHGKPLVLKEVGAAIKAANLRGLDYEKIRKDLTEFYRGSEYVLEDYVLVEGKPAKRGPGREVDYSVRFLSDKDTNVIKDRAINNPERLGDISSLDVFPVESVSQTALVEREQRLITIPPAVPGDPGMDVHGNTVPGEVAEEPAILLFENVERKQNVIISTARGLFEIGVDESDAVLIRVRTHEDAQVTVDVSPDKMRAYLSLIEGAGTGVLLDEALIEAEIEGAGVKKGIKESVVAEALSSARTQHPVSRVVIAEGQPPRNTEESVFEFLVERASGSPVTLRENGTADFKNRDTITSVSAGMEVAELRSDITDPEDGWDITGEKIPASTASGESVDLGDHLRVEQREAGRKVVIAEASGELVFENNKIEIRSAHVVQGDVGMKTGNIKFAGSVHVSGSVSSGFYVMSDGEIKVAGNVDAALLSAADNVVVQGGVHGAGKAAIRSKKGVQAAFAEQATVLSVEDFLLKSALMQCSVKCNGKIKLVGDGGRVVGGKIRTRGGLEAGSLGSSRGVKTQISFGQDYLIGDRIEIEEREIAKIKAKIAKLDTQMRKEGEGLETLRAEKRKLLKVMEKRSLRVFTLRERFEEHNESQIVVTGTVYPGVVVESHGRVHEITQPKKGVRIYFDEETGRIVEEPLKTSDK